MLDLVETLERADAEFKRGRGKRAIFDAGENFDAAEWRNAKTEIDGAPALPDFEIAE